MNPQVKVAYERVWFQWQHAILRIGKIRWWVGESPQQCTGAFADLRQNIRVAVSRSVSLFNSGKRLGGRGTLVRGMGLTYLQDVRLYPEPSRDLGTRDEGSGKDA